MRLKRNRDSFSSVHSRTRNNFTQHFRMCTVYAVEITHADERGAVVGRDVLGFVKNKQVVCGQWSVTSTQFFGLAGHWSLITGR